MQDISVLDKQIDFNCTENYRLSIQISLNGFSFGIKEAETNEYWVLKHCQLDNKNPLDLLDNLELFIVMNPLLTKYYKSIKIIVDTEKKIIIPKALFSKEHIRHTFELSHNIQDDESLYYNTDKLDSIIVFAIKNTLKKCLEKHIKNFELCSSLSPLVYYGLKKEEQLYSIIINHTSHDHFDIITCNKNKLLLLNTYKYLKDIDIVFYVLNTLQTLEIDNKECNIIFSGEFEQESQAMIFLSKHIAKSEKLSILNPPDELQKDNIDIYFANLINSEQCE